MPPFTRLGVAGQFRSRSVWIALAVGIGPGVRSDPLPDTTAYGSTYVPSSAHRASRLVPSHTGAIMVDGSDRVEFADVEVIGYRGLLLKCRVGKKRVRVPLLRILPGTTVALVGDWRQTRPLKGCGARSRARLNHSHPVG